MPEGDSQQNIQYKIKKLIDIQPNKNCDPMSRENSQ